MKLPNKTYNKDRFPYLDDNNVGKVIPILYGKCAALELIPVNENNNPESASTDAIYGLPEGTSNIGTAYVQVDNVWKAALNPVVDYIAGTLTIENGRDDGGSTRNVKIVDCYGYMFSGHCYPRDVLEHLFTVQLGVSLTASNFDLVEWAAELDAVQCELGILLNDAAEFWEVVYKISTGCVKSFRVEYNAAGKITARVKDFDRASSATISSADIYDSDVLRVSTDRSGVYSSVVCKYYKNHIANTFLSVENTTYLDEVKQTYRKDAVYELETYLVNQADAEARAYEDATRLADAPMVLSCTVDENLTLKIYDVVTIAIQQDNLDASSRAYIGNRDCMILGVKPNLLTRQNTISALIIPDRTPAASQSAVRTSAYTTVERDKSTLELAVEEAVEASIQNGVLALDSPNSPAGTYDGQLGIYQGELYEWDADTDLWVKQETIYPTVPPIIRYDFDSLTMSGSAYTKPILDNSGNGNHSIAIVGVTPL